MHDPTAPEDRRRAATSAAASVRAEGLSTTASYDDDAAAYVAGRISADELVARAEARHRVPDDQQPAD
ncbi:shikimate kinase [Kitasatospora sp. GP30]|uniref:antitoxin VbhA family protein n=1 Tax=Kitasatospora sp. GP30 TaxID=3035084 RepID=UPI000C710CD0|nr:antitoxin VbhA family protein [Kitasatospora sp. GP30]MDH6138512.1 shikimate kinase [Kitasatospora sp. GP30]